MKMKQAVTVAALSASALALGGESTAQAWKEWRNTAVGYAFVGCDRPQGAWLCGALRLMPDFSELEMIDANTGYYTSRLSTRCSDDTLWLNRRPDAYNIPTGYLRHICFNGSRPIRTEAALDDHNDLSY